MTFDEFSIIANIIKTAYPRETLFPNKQALQIWFKMIGDIEYKAAESFLEKWIATEKWSPAICDIRKGVSEMYIGEVPTWSDAWQEVMSAVRRWGYMNENKALSSMSPLARRTANALGWQSICESENIETTRAQFRQAFETYSRRETEKQQLPPALNDRLQQFLGTGGTGLVRIGHEE